MSKNHTMRLVGKIIKYLVYALIFAVMIFLVWRAFFSANPPKSMETLIANDALTEAYEKNGGLTLKYQNLDMITRVQLTEKQEKEQNRKSNYGYFAITRVDIIPEADQIQIVFRYNNSTINALAQDYGLEKVPSRNETLYDISLIRATDLTPENSSDNLLSNESSVLEERFFPTGAYTVSDEKNMYNYRKYVFENVSLEELTLALYIDIYYIEDVDYEKAAYGTLCIWDHISETFERALTADDIAAIDSRRKKHD